MPLDDSGDEPAALGVPLPPDDRLWRHPSELSTDTSAAPGGRRAHRFSASVKLGVGLLTGVAGVVLAITVATATNHAGDPAEQATPRATPISLATSSVAASLLPTIAHLTADRGDSSDGASAIVFRPDGYLLTTTQAVGDGDGLTVTLADGRSLPATVVGVDPATAVAVVHVDALSLTVAPLGHSSQLHVGDPTLTIGAAPHPGSGAVSENAVRALRTSVALPSGSVHDLIATDRAIPPAADGGAMVDASGRVTGLCLAAGPPGATPGFAVPIDVARRSAEQLIATGHVTHASLGITGASIPAELADKLGVGGVELQRVEARGPAAVAGLRPGDILVAVDGHPVSSMASLRGVTVGLAPGDAVPVAYLRDTERHSVLVQLGRD